MDSLSYFAEAPRYPKDSIFSLTASYHEDPSPLKVNLGQGAYRGEKGLPWVLPAVVEARRRIERLNLNHEYLPILGLSEFRKSACELALGSEEYSRIRSKIASCQSLSGTGALHVAGALIKNYSSLGRQVFIPDPTWSNHQQVFSALGFDCRSFRYYDPEKRCLDMASYLAMLRSAERKSVVILHACAHNPTGCDPTRDQWRQIGQIMKERELFPLFDAAYLGFRSGSIDEDAFAIRHFVNHLGLEAAVAMSFAKNMGLYGERVGCTMFVTTSQTVALNCESVLERLQRSEISNPPAYGAKIASQILKDPGLRNLWYADLQTMSSRIVTMRSKLCGLLVKHGAPGTWDHIVEQSGMFGFLGLSPQTVVELRERYHIYMSDNSRISIAGLNDSNVAYVAKSIAECLLAEKESTTSTTVLALL